MGVPIPNATVELYRNEQLVASGQTDENGRVSFRILAGRYKIVVKKEGYYTHTQIHDIYSDFVKKVYLTKFLNASGLDPNDPLWRPSEGWTTVVEFTTDTDKDVICNYACSYCVVRNHMLVFDNVPQGDWGSCEYYNPTLKLRRLAICMKLDVTEIGDEGWEGDIEITRNTSEYVRVKIYTVPNDATKIKFIVESPSGTNSYTVDVGGKWFVLVIDVENGKLQVYDQSKNLVLDVDFPWIDFRYGLDVFMGIYEDNHVYYTTGYVTVDTSVDWIALYVLSEATAKIR